MNDKEKSYSLLVMLIQLRACIKLFLTEERLSTFDVTDEEIANSVIVSLLHKSFFSSKFAIIQ